jgi:hypothetical protein
MTNYGAIAILKALPAAGTKHEGRQLRILIAIETFRSDSDGWRRIGQDLLARTANVSVPTLKRARADLINAKLIDYEPSRTKGVVSGYRLLVDGIKGVQHAEPLTDLSGTGRDSARSGFTTEQIGVHHPGQKGFTTKPDKSNVAAGLTRQTGDEPNRPALRAKAQALKAEGFSSPGDAPQPGKPGASPSPDRTREGLEQAARQREQLLGRYGPDAFGKHYIAKVLTELTQPPTPLDNTTAVTAIGKRCTSCNGRLTAVEQASRNTQCRWCQASSNPADPFHFPPTGTAW